MDNLSGIGRYEGRINGRWMLFEYDAKNNLLEYRIDDHFPVKEGQYALQLKVSDEVGNEATKTIRFTRNQKR
ncbi:MAG TPA: hypothetical protein PK990_09365 [Salinivirgaceae bacterium]|nr:hypothetical protein [Salinivirgaceae bacterium]